MEGTLFDLDGRAASTRAVPAGGSRLGRGLQRRPDGPWLAWHVVTAAVLVGLIAAEVAVNQAIGGAATAAQQTLLAWSIALAVLLIPAGVVARSHLRGTDPRGARASAATDGWMAGIAGVVELARSSVFVSRLVDHVRLDRDEPLTTVSIALQLVIALTFAVGFAAFAALGRRRARAA